jgi:hypothetical protein
VSSVRIDGGTLGVAARARRVTVGAATVSAAGAATVAGSDLDHVDLFGDDARRDGARDRADGAEGQRQGQTDEAGADEDRAENGPDLTGVDLDTGGGAVGEVWP